MANTKDKDAIWRRIGLTPKNCQERIESIESGLKRWGRYNDIYGPTTPENPTTESYVGRSRDLFCCFEQIQLAHLGVPHLLGESRKIIETAAQLGVDLFCGSWRDHALLHSGKVLNRKQCRAEFDQWIDSFRIALFFALINQNQQQAAQIASYIGDDLDPDEGSWDRVENDRLAYWLISEFVGQNKAPKKAADTIKKGRAKRPKLLLALLEAIQQQDAAAFDKPLGELVKLFRDNEMKLTKRDINTVRIVTSIDASVMWNLARFNGLEVGALADDVADHVITSESVAISDEQT